MFDVKSAVKDRIVNAIEILPYGRDLYLMLTGSRAGLCYRGRFDVISQAQAAIDKNKNSHYDVINNKKSKNEDREKNSIERYIDDHDYPLLFWLAQILSEGDVILELGGSIGHFFYRIQKYIELPREMRWTIAELPEAVALGQKLAEERQETRLKFVDSTEISNTPPVRIFLTAGTLQYMDLELPKLLASLPERPPHVLSHTLPVHQNKSYMTLQNLNICEVPYRIYSRAALENGMRDLGYTLKASWTHKREVEIPFHRDLRIDGYCGHYFVLEG